MEQERRGREEKEGEGRGEKEKGGGGGGEWPMSPLLESTHLLWVEHWRHHRHDGLQLRRFAHD